ncbi:MAG: hypothetical protein KAY37_00965 [Phycisphaerae bacterium]|nr:hypothetical protein [Phycisphaerae bacterium]
MANPASVDAKPASIVATATPGSVELNSDRRYGVGHNQKDSDGAYSTHTIYLGFNAPPPATPAEGPNKADLLGDPARSLPIPKGVAALHFATESGEATFTITPLE